MATSHLACCNAKYDLVLVCNSLVWCVGADLVSLARTYRSETSESCRIGETSFTSAVGRLRKMVNDFNGNANYPVTWTKNLQRLD